MLTVVLALIIIYIIAGIVGFVVHGLFWLFIVAALLFIATIAASGMRAGRRRRR